MKKSKKSAKTKDYNIEEEYDDEYNIPYEGDDILDMEEIRNIQALANKKLQKKPASPDSLIGKCLVYIGDSANELYDKSVIFITECTKQTVKGIMINKLLFGTASVECKNRISGNNEIRNIYEDLYQGGPENPAHGFVLFPKDDNIARDPFADIHGEIAVSSSFGILQEILEGVGPEKKIIAMGHCSWLKGELEWELFNNKWLIVPCNSDLMFDTALSNRWERALQDSGIKRETYINNIGLA